MASVAVGSPWLHRIIIIPDVHRSCSGRRIGVAFLRRRFSASASAAGEGSPILKGGGGGGGVRVRFAPSPTGNLHVGGARTALVNYLFARSKGGKFVLRIEDTDRERSTRESEEAVLRDLTWLGLDWDEGPGVGGDYGPYRQSERNILYKQYADKLLKSGHVYRYFCSNEEVEQMKEIANLKQLPPVYARKWAYATDEEVEEELAKGTPYTYRFRVPKEGNFKISDLIRGEVTAISDLIFCTTMLWFSGYPVDCNLFYDHDRILLKKKELLKHRRNLFTCNAYSTNMKST